MYKRAEGRPSKRIRHLPAGAETRGFSILELIIAMGILAIVLAIAYPSYNRMVANGNLRTAARDIQSDIASLKGRAVAENSQFTVFFDTGANSYTITRISDGAVISTKSPASFGQGIQITAAPFGGGTTIALLTRGTIQDAGNIQLINSRGSTARIVCNISGRTYVQFNMQ